MTNTLTIILIILIAFLVGRELACWYFKINEGLDLLSKIEKHLSKDLKNQD